MKEFKKICYNIINCEWYNDIYFEKILCSQGKKCKHISKCLKKHICGYCKYKKNVNIYTQKIYKV